MFELALLGAPTLLLGGKPVRLLKKSLALLALLAMEQPKSHERLFLSPLFWPDLPTHRANHSLRMALGSLRKIFDSPGAPAFSQEHWTHVRLNPEVPLQVDALRILRPPSSCTLLHDPEDCPSCEMRLTRGLREIRGPFMEGFSLPDCEEFEHWMTGVREEIQVRVRWSTDRLIRLYEKRGTPFEALAVLEGVLRMDPLDEGCHGRMMLLLAETGNTIAALAQYEILRKELRDQLGLEPSSEIRAIYDKIRLRSPERELPRLSERGALFPENFFSPEWRPATALSVEFSEEGGDEAGAPSPEIREALARAARMAEDLGGVPGRREAHSFLTWFGISGQAEGAARRAARTALALRKIVEEMQDKARQRISIAVGIHAGRILRSAPDTPPDPTGTVSRTALALSMQAGSGEILVSAEAARLLRGQFRLGEAGEFRILGRRTKGYTLRGEAEAGNEPRAGHLFGRDSELGTLEELWRQNNGAVVVVEGDAGIGKSALVRSFVASPVVREGLLLTIECFPQFVDSPLYPVVRSLRGSAEIPEEMDAGEAYPRLLLYVRSLSLPEERTAVALLGKLFSLPPLPEFPLPAISSAEIREETMKLLLSLLLARSRKRRVLFLVEDIHWTDAATGDLLRRLLSDPLFTRRIFFLVTTRPGEDPPWLGTLPDRTAICLPPLAALDSRAMIQSLNATGSLPDAEISRILAAADGVPLFLEELTRERLEAAGGSGSLLLPGTLSEVLASRLDRLEESRVLLQRAAVYGRSVPMDLLRALSPEPPERFDALLARAVLSGLVSLDPAPSGELFCFHHALIAEAALQTLPLSQRKRLYRQIAETLRDRFPERAAATPEHVALSFEAAGEFPLALPWFEKAVAMALAHGFLSEAARFSRKALETLSLCPPSPELKVQEIRLLIGLGTLLFDLEGNGSPEGEAAIQKACSLIDSKTELTEETFYAFYNLWAFQYEKVDLRSFRDQADFLLGLADRSDRRDFRIAARYADGSTACWEGRFPHAIAALDRVLAIPEETDVGPEAQSIVREALDYKLWTLWFLGRYRSAGLLADTLLARLRSSDANRKKGHLLTFAMVLYRYLRLSDRVLEIAGDLEQAIHAMKVQVWSAAERAFRGWAMVENGDPGGLPHVLQGLALARRYHPIAENKYLSLLSECWLRLGEPGKACEVALSGLQFSEKSGALFYDAELWRLRGEALLMEGSREEARRSFETAIGISRRQGGKALELRALSSLLRLFLSGKEKSRARELLPDLSGILDDPESDPSLPDIREALDLRSAI